MVFSGGLAFLATVLAIAVLTLLKEPVTHLIYAFDPTVLSASEALNPTSFGRLVLLPVAQVATFIVSFSPGILIAASLLPTSDLRKLVLAGFGITTVSVSVILTFAGSGGHTVFGYTAACVALCLAGAIFARLSNVRNRAPVTGLRDVVIAAAFGYALVVLFSQKLALEAFNGDGFQSFFASLSVVERNTPFSPAESEMGAYPDLATAAPIYPTAWHILTLGAHEYAARMLSVIVFPLMYLAFTSIAANVRAAKIGLFDRVLIILALTIFFLSGAFSMTYEVYSDISLPFQREAFFSLVFVAIIVFAQESEPAGPTPLIAALFALLACASLPSGAGLLLLLFVLVLAQKWRSAFQPGYWAILIVAVCFLGFSVIARPLFEALGAVPPGEEFSAGALTSRFRYISLWDFEEFLFAAVPLGIGSAIIGIVSFRKGDALNKALVLSGIGYFLVFYFQAYRTLLHHFVPVAICFYIASLRSVNSNPKAARITQMVVVAGLVVSFYLSWPTTFTTEHRLQMTARKISPPIDYPVNSDIDTLLAAHQALTSAIPEVEYFQRLENGLAQTAHAALAFYIARTKPISDSILIRLCSDSACRGDETYVGSYGDTRIGLAYGRGADEDFLPIRMPEEVRFSTTLGVRVSKVFRRVVDEGQDDRDLVDLKALFGGPAE